MNGLDIIDADQRGSADHFTEAGQKLKQRIEDGRIVILKNCFAVDSLLALKKAVQHWGQRQAVFPAGRSASVANLNFHRIDGADMPTRLPHTFHQYGFGNLDKLDPGLRSVLYQVAEPMLALQNSVAGTNYQLSDPEVRVKFLHYPSGGGYLANHIHPLLPQRVGLITSLSDWEADYSEGGNIFSTDAGDIHTSPSHQIGDVLLFRYDIPHEIEPIDPHQVLDWNALAGKWSLVLELLSTNALSDAI